MDQLLAKKLNGWHYEGEHQRIIQTILKVPTTMRDYNLIGHLARAYNNTNDYKKAIEVLRNFKDQGVFDYMWYFRLGFAYYEMGNFYAALQAFESCGKLNPLQRDLEYFLHKTKRELSQLWRLHLEDFDKPVELTTNLFESTKKDRYGEYITPIYPMFGVSTSNNSRNLYITVEKRMLELAQVLADIGYDRSIKGWASYFANYMNLNSPMLCKIMSIQSDKDVLTLSIPMKEGEDRFQSLLSSISESIRKLYIPDQPLNPKEDFVYVAEMIRDPFYPTYLVQNLRYYIKKFVEFLEEGGWIWEDILFKLDEMTQNINTLQDDFQEAGSAIDDYARMSISITVNRILMYYDVGIDIDTALRKRLW
jgi:tetratricopeptide (TPR) repeat protein